MNPNGHGRIAFAQQGTTGRIDIEGRIGGWDMETYKVKNTAELIKAQLAELGDVDAIELHINSGGGLMFDGIAVMNALVQHPAKVTAHVDGIAGSIASVIIMGADEIVMPSNTLLFIHQPLTVAQGNADEMLKTADALRTMEDVIVASYQRHTSLTADEILAIMKADTWLTAAEAADVFGVTVDEMPLEVAAEVDLAELPNVPPAALALFGQAADEPKNEDQTMDHPENLGAATETPAEPSLFAAITAKLDSIAAAILGKPQKDDEDADEGPTAEALLAENVQLKTDAEAFTAQLEEATAKSAAAEAQLVELSERLETIVLGISEGKLAFHELTEAAEKPAAELQAQLDARPPNGTQAKVVTAEELAEPVNVLDTFESLAGAERTAYYREHKDEIKAAMKAAK